MNKIDSPNAVETDSSKRPGPARSDIAIHGAKPANGDWRKVSMKRGPACDFKDLSGDLVVIALSLRIGKKSLLVFPAPCLESCFT